MPNTGIEPANLRLLAPCSNQLSYAMHAHLYTCIFIILASYWCCAHMKINMYGYIFLSCLLLIFYFTHAKINMIAFLMKYRK